MLCACTSSMIQLMLIKAPYWQQQTQANTWQNTKAEATMCMGKAGLQCSGSIPGYIRSMDMGWQILLPHAHIPSHSRITMGVWRGSSRPSTGHTAPADSQSACPAAHCLCAGVLSFIKFHMQWYPARPRLVQIQRSQQILFLK